MNQDHMKTYNSSDVQFEITEWNSNTTEPSAPNSLQREGLREAYKDQRWKQKPRKYIFFVE